jgi:hypothetical protein
VRREQFTTDCLVTFQLPDTTYANWVMLSVRARGQGGTLIGRGAAYAETGFGPADRVTVSVQNVQCTEVVSFDLSMLPALPKPPLHWADPLPVPRREPGPS